MRDSVFERQFFFLIFLKSFAKWQTCYGVMVYFFLAPPTSPKCYIVGQMSMGIWVHEYMGLCSFMILSHIHGCDGPKTQVQTSYLLLEKKMLNLDQLQGGTIAVLLKYSINNPQNWNHRQKHNKGQLGPWVPSCFLICSQN